MPPPRVSLSTPKVSKSKSAPSSPVKGNHSNPQEQHQQQQHQQHQQEQHQQHQQQQQQHQQFPRHIAASALNHTHPQYPSALNHNHSQYPYGAPYYPPYPPYTLSLDAWAYQVQAIVDAQIAYIRSFIWTQAQRRRQRNSKTVNFNLRDKEKGVPTTSWSRYVIAALIATNALLVFFDRANVDVKGMLRKGDSDLRRTTDDSDSSRITPEDLDKVLTEDVERFAVRIRRRHVTTGHGLQGFVQFSSYRIDTRVFAALGLSPLSLHGQFRANSCRWDDNGGIPQNGTVTVHYPGESFRKQYEAMIIICELPHDIMSTRVATRERPIEPLSRGGNLTVFIDQDPVVVYHEEAQTPLILEPYKKYPHSITMCSGPVAKALHSDRTQQWMRFHANLHSVDFFVFYDAGGMDYDMGQVLEEFWNKGMVEVRDIRDTIQYDSYHYSELLVINDCLYRHRYTSKWALYMEFDQYLFIAPVTPLIAGAHSPSGETLTAAAIAQTAEVNRNSGVPAELGQSLLKFLDAGKWTWVSFGAYVFSVYHCSPLPDISDGDEYAVERMLFREPTPYCRLGSTYKKKHMCLKSDGQRRYVVNPRKVIANQINRVLSGEIGGHNAHTSEAHISHFRGLADAQRTLCTYTFDSGKVPKRYKQDDTIASLAVFSRRKQKVLST